MDNFIQTGAVACGINVRGARFPGWRPQQSARLRSSTPARCQCSAGAVLGSRPEGKQDFRRGNRFTGFLPWCSKLTVFSRPPRRAAANQKRVGGNPHTFALKHLRPFRLPASGSNSLQQLFAALDKGDLHAEPREELGELTRQSRQPPRMMRDLGISLVRDTASSLVMNPVSSSDGKRCRRHARAGGEDQIVGR